MQTLRVALAQLNTTVGDCYGNAERMFEAAAEAANLGADLVAFPELAITGYPPEDLLLRQPFIAEAETALNGLATRSRGLPPLIVGCLDFDRHLYNAAAILHDGRIVGRYRKQLLPNYGVFDEMRYFQPGNMTPLYRIGGATIGITICEDIWYPAGPAHLAALNGAQVIININASPFHAGKTRQRERMIATRAADNQVAIAYINQVGGQDELVFDGNSLVFGPGGELIARGASMSEDLLVVDIPIDAITQAQLHEPRLRRERSGELSPVPIAVTEAPAADRPDLVERNLAPPDALAETYQALVTGARDYLGKTGFSDAIVALSGGIDSALVAAIAVDALGPEHVLGVSMPSRYSSEGSIADAQTLADNLGIRMQALPIEAMHQATLDTLARPFTGLEPGVAEENVQSRLRGLLVMALANKFGSIVLTTGNKSEYACGYATLYGDMVGGFAVIKDVPKTLVYQLAHHRNTLGEVIPESSLLKPPSAELRPGQLDTDSLPPYEILDPIIEAYVEDDESAEAIVARGYTQATVERVIGMINRNEYKRRQSPPGVKITPRAFGRDRRLPLASRYTGI